VDVSYLPGVIGYLSQHSEVSQSLSVGVAAAVAVMVAIFLRAMIRTARPRPNEAAATLTALDVVICPLSVIAAITVIERFRLLA
jgi:chromate transport protein ChrA